MNSVNLQTQNNYKTFSRCKQSPKPRFVLVLERKLFWPKSYGMMIISPWSNGAFCTRKGSSGEGWVLRTPADDGKIQGKRGREDWKTPDSVRNFHIVYIIFVGSGSRMNIRKVAILACHCQPVWYRNRCWRLRWKFFSLNVVAHFVKCRW